MRVILTQAKNDDWYASVPEQFVFRSHSDLEALFMLKEALREALKIVSGRWKIALANEPAGFEETVREAEG